MSGHLADVPLGPKEWASLILALKRKWEELKSYNSTTYSLRKVTSEELKRRLLKSGTRRNPV